MIREIEVSLDRYKHYIEDPDGIRPSEISKYNKDWMARSLDMIYPNFLLKSYTEKIRELFQEVLANYSLTMKHAILNYILRSPIERKRLHILMIPREVPSSSTKIALRGGYSTKIYEEWHKAKKDAEAEVKIKMIWNNIVMGSLVNWWYDFRDIKLFKFQGIKPDNIDYTITKDDLYTGLPSKRQLTAVENIEFTKSGHTIKDEYNPPKEEIKDLQQYISKIVRSVSYCEENEFDTTLHIPEFILNDYIFCPIIDLFLKINKQSLNLDKSEDDIVKSIITTIDDTIECLNTF